MSALQLSAIRFCTVVALSIVQATAETTALLTDLKFGQSIDLSGPASDISGEIIDGLNAAFNEATRLRRVPGKSIKLVIKDDAFDPAKTAINTAQFIEDGEIFGLIGTLGTQQTQEMLSVLMAKPMPLMCPFTGGDSIRLLDKNVFHIRAGFREEANAIVKQLLTSGLRRVALVYQDDPMGREGLANVSEFMSLAGEKLVVALPMDRSGVRGGRGVTDLLGVKPDAVIFFAVGKGVIDLIHKFRINGGTAQLITISANANEKFIKALGGFARGLGMSQVVPSPWNAGVPVVKAYQDAMGKIGKNTYSPTSLEGYLCGRVLIEGLVRAPPPITREAFVQALERLGTLDLGGYEVRYSTRNHLGATFVGLSVIGGNGKSIY